MFSDREIDRLHRRTSAIVSQRRASINKVASGVDLNGELVIVKAD